MQKIFNLHANARRLAKPVLVPSDSDLDDGSEDDDEQWPGVEELLTSEPGADMDLEVSNKRAAPENELLNDSVMSDLVMGEYMVKAFGDAVWFHVGFGQSQKLWVAQRK